MPTVVGVRIRPSGKVLTFDAAETSPVPGDRVVVRTERGEEFGEVVEGVSEIAEADLQRALKPVLRIATEADVARADEFRAEERAAMERYRRLVDEHGLDMKPVDVERLFDGKKMIFYFVAEERVDFRDLVKELAREFNTRIDMRQIGVRDEARMLGGIGHCGQQLCCVRLGGEFEPVSIRMAKAQDLPLNPLKISGVCGRLMCCLRYEYEAYKDFKSRAPKSGKWVDTPKGEVRVVGLDAPRETVTLDVSGTRVTLPLCALECDRAAEGRYKVSPGAFEEATRRDVGLLVSKIEAGSPKAESESRPKRKRRSRRSRSKKSGAPASQGGSGGKGGQRRPEDSQGQGGGRKSGRGKGGGKSGGKGGQGGGQPRGAKSGQGGKASGQGGKGAQDGGSARSPGTPPARRRRRRRRSSPGGGGGSGGAPAGSGAGDAPS